MCEQLIGELRPVFPTIYGNRDWPGIINLISVQSVRYREAYKVQPTLDIDQGFVGVRTGALAAGVDMAKLNSYNQKYSDTRLEVLRDYDKIWFDLAAKMYGAISARDVLTVDFEPLFTTFRTDCTAAITAMAKSLKTGRDALSAMLKDASQTLVGPQSLYTDLFNRGTIILNSRLFDVFLSHMESAIWSYLQQYNAKLKNQLHVLVASSTLRINQSNSVNKVALINTLNTALDSFDPANTQSDAAAILTAQKAGAETAIAAMRSILSPLDLQTAVLNMMTVYAKTAEAALNKLYTDKTNIQFNKALDAILAVVPT